MNPSCSVVLLSHVPLLLCLFSPNPQVSCTDQRHVLEREGGPGLLSPRGPYRLYERPAKDPALYGMSQLPALLPTLALPLSAPRPTFSTELSALLLGRASPGPGHVSILRRPGFLLGLLPPALVVRPSGLCTNALVHMRAARSSPRSGGSERGHALPSTLS